MRYVALLPRHAINLDLTIQQSLKVRTSYIDQLRNSDVIGSYFIPGILSLLCLDIGPSKAFKLDIWAVDEFEVQCTCHFLVVYQN